MTGAKLGSTGWDTWLAELRYTNSEADDARSEETQEPMAPRRSPASVVLYVFAS
jgi:hypothetical protein